MFRPFLKLFPSCKCCRNNLKLSFYPAPQREYHSTWGPQWPQCLRTACVHTFIWGVPCNSLGQGCVQGQGLWALLPEGFLGPQHPQRQDQRDEEAKHLAILSKGSHHTRLIWSPASLLTWWGSAITGVSGICYIKGIGSGLHWEEIMGNKCP